MKRNQPGWGPAAQPQQHYLVAPRHLAGGGDLTHITDYLTAANWKNRTPRSKGGGLLFESADKTMRITYFPDGNAPGWAVAGSPPGHPELAWGVTLSAAVPVEILAGLTEALSQPRPTHAPKVLAQMTGWSKGKGKHPTAGHPDGTALLQYRTDGPSDAWIATAHTPGPGRSTVPLWSGVFSQHTPLYAVEAFAAALADPRPLLRPPGAIPFVAAAHVRATPYAVLPSQLTAMRQARTAAGRAAAWARNAAHRTRRPFRTKPAPTTSPPTQPTRSR